MNVFNGSTITQTVTVAWPDGSTQAVDIASLQMLNFPGLVIGGSTQFESFDHQYEYTFGVDGTGVLHETYNFTGFFLPGFWWGLGIFFTIVAIQVVRRGLSVSGYRPSGGVD